ncbi:hypothetical protein FGIG_09317 [Fasciola gigantica]|uniref:Uncharacterized protein n=1 Tax=Fasciola gigantica TaxID=46835 RepID=A0A504YY12_FASGI|nr:hypothetical protein FGIG_09317 [Fasciola gigantica]
MIQENSPGQVVQEKCLRLISCLQNKGYTYDQWLCLHSNDALLMVDVLQEFFVVFCVDGEFGERLEEFRQEALNIVSLESSLDHPTCVEVLRFEAPPAAVPKIYKFFYNSAQFLQSRLKRTSLDLSSSTTKEPNSVGLNFTDPETKTILHEFSVMLVSDLIRNCPDVAILPEPQRTYPCTDLAVVHAFVSEQFADLCQLYDTLVADIENNQTPDWSIRLYSRDPRLRVPDPQVG